MHTAFALAPLLRTHQLGKDAITSVLLHTDRILLGTDKGTLLVFDLSPATEAAPARAELVSRHEGFANKSVDQLAIIKELNALVCLSGGDISLHSLPGYSVLSSFSTQTKATASLFALSTTIHTPLLTPTRSSSGKSSAGQHWAPPEIHTTLAIACRRRLLIFSWIDGSWLPPTEVSLPHQIRGMAFDESGDKRRLVAGFSTGEYGVVTLSPYPNHEGRLPPDNSNLPPPTLGDLFSPAVPLPALTVEPIKDAPRGKAAALGGHLGGLGSVMSLSGLSTSLASIGGGKKVDKNGVVAVPKGVGKGKEVMKGELEESGDWLRGKEWGWDDEESGEGEVLAVRDNLLVALSSAGKIRGSSSNSGSPSTVAYASSVDETLVLPPYVVSLLAPPPPPAPAASTSTPAPSPAPTFPSLSIHSIEDLANVQTISIPPHTPPTSLASASAAEPPKPVSARLLTAASSTNQPPMLLLTSSPSPPGVTTLNASDQTLWIVNATPWAMQIDELGAQGKWEESVRLLRRSGPSSSGSLPAELLRKLSILHSMSLFNQLRFGLAVDAFINLNVSPAKVISLYPEQISGKLFLELGAREASFGGRTKEQVEAEKEKEEQEALEAAAAVAESGAAGEGAVSGSPAKKKYLEEAVSTSPAKGAGGIAGALRASASWRDLPRSTSLSPSPSRKATSAQTQPTLPSAPASLVDPKAFREAVDELVRFLTDRRQKYAQALAALLPSSRPSPSDSRPTASREELLALPDLPLNKLTPEQLARAAQVVDTALFKSYLATKPVMVGPLCRIENWCEVEEVEEILSAKGKYRELLDLYNGKGMHDRAVRLLKKLADDEDDEEEKVDPTIRYLQKLGSAHLPLILETSQWVFEADPKAAMQIFIADLEEVESLPRHATMAHLERISPEACTTYLEHLVHTLGEEGPEFHEKLIELYLARVHSTKAGKEDEAYAKLLALLESSTAYRADRMLGRLPSEDMHQVRAILLGRLGRHEGALQIYVYQMGDHATAEAYCARVYANSPAMRSTIFILLLRLYLRPRAGHPMLYEPALELISNHAAKMDPIEVFDLLPPLVGVKDLQVWLERSLRRAGEKKRENRVLRSLGRAALDEKEEQVVGLESRRVRIDEGRLCPQCHKRLGNSVIAIHSPVGEVTHYQCREAFIEGKGLRA